MSLLESITTFKRDKLKQCETVVRANCYIQGPQKGQVLHNTKHKFDKPEDLQLKIAQLAKLMKEAKHLVILTGSGITATNTDKGIVNDTLAILKTTEIEKTFPTITHMAIKSLIDSGICNMLVSSNVDGLHRRTGVKEEQMSELYGNEFREYCKKCEKEFLRTFNCSALARPDSHQTGNKCETCQSMLHDSIVRSDEQIPLTQYKRATHSAKIADLFLILGTVLNTSPLNTLPFKNKDATFVIVNKEVTEYDKMSQIRIFADCNDFVQLLMKELNIPIDLHAETPSESFTIGVPPISHNRKYKQSIAASSAPAPEVPAPGSIVKQPSDSENVLKNIYLRKNVEFKNLNEREYVINSTVAARNSLIFIEKCSGLNCKIAISSSKIILLDLKDCVIEVNQPVLTSVLEMIHCKNVTVRVQFAVETVTVDKSEYCHFSFYKSELMASLYTCQSSDISVSPSFSSPKFNVVSSEYFEVDPDAGIPQFISRFTTTGQLATEVVIREGVGYATTKREKDIADARQEFLASKLSEIVSSSITFTKY